MRHLAVTLSCAALAVLLAPMVQAAIPKPVRGGKLTDSCTPWDGPAFTIRLDNNLSVNVYETFSPTVAGRSFRAANMQEQAGDSIIMRCAGPYNGCVTYEGVVSVNGVDGDYITGTVEITQNKPPVHHDFRVLYDRGFRPVCG